MTAAPDDASPKTLQAPAPDPKPDPTGVPATAVESDLEQALLAEVTLATHKLEKRQRRIEAEILLP